MKAKKIFGLLMASAMVASFAACSSDDENEDPIPTQPGNEQTPVNPDPTEPGNEFTPIHSVTLTDTTVSAEGCTFDVIINCNVECVETTDNPEMITTSCAKGEGDVCILTVTVAPNTTYEQVTGKIIVEFTDAEGNAIEDATAEITITQEGLEAPYFTYDDVVTTDLEYTEQAIRVVNISTNCTFTTTTDVEWITLAQQTENMITYIVAAYDVYTKGNVREGNITITYTDLENNPTIITIPVSQKGRTEFIAKDLWGTSWDMPVTQGPMTMHAHTTFGDGTENNQTVTMQTIITDADNNILQTEDPTTYMCEFIALSETTLSEEMMTTATTQGITFSMNYFTPTTDETGNDTTVKRQYHIKYDADLDQLWLYQASFAGFNGFPANRVVE